MKILITGANGMLGYALGEVLKGHELTGTGIGESGHLTFPFHVCDITDPEAVLDLVETVKPDAVLHAAAFTDVDRAEQEPERALAVNFEGTKNLLKSFVRKKPFFVLISTDYVFDGIKKTPYLETDVPNPVSAYGKSKWLAENVIRENFRSGLTVRTSWLYGPRGKNFVDTVLRLSREREVLGMVDDQRGRPTYTFDLATALGKIFDRCSALGGIPDASIQGTMHVANSGEATWLDFAREIFLLTGSRTKLEAISSAQLGRSAPRPAYSVLDVSRYEKFAGAPLRSWKEALAEYIRRWAGAGVKSGL